MLNKQAQNSAELKGPRTLLRIRLGTFDFEPDLGLKLGQTKPNISGTVPTHRHTRIPNDSGPISAGFGEDPNTVKTEEGPRTFLRVRPGIFDIEPGLGLKRGHTQPNIRVVFEPCRRRRQGLKNH